MTRLVSIAVLVGICGGLAGCSKDDIPLDLSGVVPGKVSDEEQILLVLDEVQRGMESRRIFQVVAHLARSYQDRDGRDYDAMVEYLNTIFENYREIRVRRAKPRILVQGTQARVVETFGTIADPRNPADYPPINLHGQVTLYLEKVDNRWLIVEWGPIS